MEIKLFKLRLDLEIPFRIAHGSYPYRESVFVWLRSGEAVGMGEAPVVPYYGLSTEAVEADLKQGLSRRTVVEEAMSGSDIPTGAFAHAPSRSAFQAAVVSLRARLSGIPFPKALGIGEATGIAPTSYTVAYNDDPEVMARAAAECGFRRLKVKAGIPGDIMRIRVLRERLPQAIIRVDANQGWSVEEAHRKIAELERIGVELVEEPIAGSPAEIERLAASSPLPILLDESVRDIEDLRRIAREAPSVAGIVVKTAKNGGPMASAELARAARECGMRVMVSSMIESSLGVSAALGLAPLCDWSDLDAPLLLAADPFMGLAYMQEVPQLVGEAVIPGPHLASFIEGLAPLSMGE